MGKQDIDLVLKRSTDGGRTWSPMMVIEDPGELWSAANPATVVDRQTGRVWVLYLRSQPERSTDTSRPGTDDMQTLARYSADNGLTWSEPLDLTKVARDYDDPTWQASVVGPGGAIQTKSGRLVAPVWKVKPYGVLAIFSDDHGQTWQRGSLMPGKQGGDEDQIVELADGRLLLDIRQNSGPTRLLATSSDGGQTWSEPRPGVCGYSGRLCDRAADARVGRRRSQPHPLDRPPRPGPQDPGGPHELRRGADLHERATDSRRTGRLLGPHGAQRQVRGRALGAGRLSFHHVHPPAPGISGTQVASMHRLQDPISA